MKDFLLGGIRLNGAESKCFVLPELVCSEASVRLLLLCR